MTKNCNTKTFVPVIIHLAVNKLLKNFSRLKKPHAKAQSHDATVGVQNFEPLHFCLLLETLTKNKPLLAAISSFLTGL
jgi:hypothetical protein